MDDMVRPERAPRRSLSLSSFKSRRRLIEADASQKQDLYRPDLFKTEVAHETALLGGGQFLFLYLPAI
jgi:hypothetical protein